MSGFKPVIKLTLVKAPSSVRYEEQVELPLFSVTSGSFEEPIRVEIICLTDGATIHYTTDGSIPNGDSAVYSEPIVFEETKKHWLKAIAVKDGWRDSPVQSAEYKLNLST